MAAHQTIESGGQQGGTTRFTLGFQQTYRCCEGTGRRASCDICRDQKTESQTTVATA